MEKCPNPCATKRLLVLDLAALIAGAKYRGEFEERLKGVLNDLAKDDGNTLISSMKSILWSALAKPTAQWTRAIC